MKKDKKLQRIADAIRITINEVVNEFGVPTHDEPNTADDHQISVTVYFDTEEYTKNGYTDKHGINWSSNTVSNWYNEPALTVSECYNCTGACKEYCKKHSLLDKYLSGDNSFMYWSCYGDDYIPHYLWGNCFLFPRIKRVIAYNVETGYGYSCRVFHLGKKNSFILKKLNLYHDGELLEDDQKLKAGCVPDYSDSEPVLHIIKEEV